MKNTKINAFIVLKLYCFAISLWEVSWELYSLINDKIRYDAIFVNYLEIAQFALSIYGLIISIIFRVKTNTIYQIIWWIPQLLMINKVSYGLKSVVQSDTIFDLSLLLRMGFSWGYKDEFDVYTMCQINIIAIVAIILLLVEREWVTRNKQQKLGAA
jgi:hypothetical protein